MDTVCGEMLCLHNKPPGKIKTGKGTLWVCQQPSTCHFSCSEDKQYVYSRAVERFLSTNQARPLCCMGEGTSCNYAKMKVVISLARPFFVCSKKDDPCNYFAWGDEHIIPRPLCKHGKPCDLEKIDKEGPNQERYFFCCPEPKKKDCNFFIWFDVFQRPGLRYFRPK